MTPLAHRHNPAGPNFAWVFAWVFAGSVRASPFVRRWLPFDAYVRTQLGHRVGPALPRETRAVNSLAATLARRVLEGRT